jgi:hypothetical protein
VFDKLIEVLRFGCSYEAIADSTCSAGTIRDRRDEGIKAGLFAQFKADRAGRLRPPRGLAAGSDRGGRVHHQAGGGECAGPSPVDRRKQGMTRSLMVEGYSRPVGPGAARREPARLAAVGPDLGQARAISVRCPTT